MVEAILFLPLFSALITGLFCRVMSARIAVLFTNTCLLLAAIFSCIMLQKMMVEPYNSFHLLLPWVESGHFHTSWGIRIDSLTVIMLVVVTIVSFLVHLYSAGYMSHDPHVPRFMAYLSLFTFFMILLVTSNNLLQLFVGWEGVGVSSYLLIGFWFQKPSACAAAMKAFIVNRVGDFGFLLGLLGLYSVFGSLDFDIIFNNVALHKEESFLFLGKDLHVLSVICGLLFIGAMGKSAQFGLHVWLPDAMEGPTPVSALIHAATMVTAGVFLVARCSPLFEHAPFILTCIICIGALTSLFAATVAITQTDIKRIIAFSTCSQLGYMFLACGVSAYSAGIFHLMTHAFFKALLFLGAGSVIHALDGEQNIHKMGNLWKKIPYTYLCMWIGSLALAGIPPFAGYYSKDLILEAAYAAGQSSSVAFYAYVSAIIVVFLTSFYSWRLLLCVFHGEKNHDDSSVHIHESSFVMLLPLFILSIGSIGAGWFGDSLLHMGHASSELWGKILVDLHTPTILEQAHHIPESIKHIPLLLGIAGILMAFLFYGMKPQIPGLMTKHFPRIYQFLYSKWYVDELYAFLFVRPAFKISSFCSNTIDKACIDRWGPGGLSEFSLKASEKIRQIHTGLMQHYVFAMLIGLCVFLARYVPW